MENSLANTIQRLKNLSNKDLYEIIEYPDDYQAHVYDLAKKELENRNLTINEEKEIQSFYQEKKEKKQKDQEAIEARQKFLRNWLDKFNINGSDRVQAKIYWVCIGLGLFLLYFFQGYFSYLSASITYGGLDIWTAEYVMPLFVIPLIILGLLRNQAYGWVLGVMYLIYKTLFQYYVLYTESALGSSTGFITGVDWLMSVAHIVWILFYALMLVALISADVRARLNVSHNLKIASFIIPILIFLALYGTAFIPKSSPANDQLRMQDFINETVVEEINLVANK